MTPKALLREIAGIWKTHLKMASYHFFLVFHRPAEIIKDYNDDKKLGIDTLGWYFTKNDTSPYKDQYPANSLVHSELKQLMDSIKLGENDVFIDIGCGAGRVKAAVAAKRLKKVMGIEIEERVVMRAKENASTLKVKNTDIEIFQADAGNFDYKGITVYFINNPFGWKTLIKVRGAIKKSLEADPRKIRIIYYGLYNAVFDMADWLNPEGKLGSSKFFEWRHILPSARNI